MYSVDCVECVPTEAEQGPLLDHTQGGVVEVLAVPDRPLVVRPRVGLARESGDERYGAEDQHSPARTAGPK